MTLFAQNHTVVSAAPYLSTPIGYQQITSLSTVIGLTVPANAQWALIQVEGTTGTDFVRWRDDGTAPTTSVGMLLGSVPSSSTGLLPQQSAYVYTGDLSKIQFIGSGSPKLNVSYYL